MNRLELICNDVDIHGSLPELILLRDALNAAIAGGAGSSISLRAPKQIRVTRCADFELCSKCGIRLESYDSIESNLCRRCKEE